MITIHQKNETNFTGNGDGSIDESIINPVVSWEMNGEFRFDFEYPFVSKFSKYIVNQNILRVPVPFMENQLFRIYRTRKTLDSIQVEARHIFYDLLDNLIDETRTVNQSGQPAIQNILNATQYPHRFEGLSDITTTGNIELILCNPVEALLDDNKANSFISQLGGEILRDNFRIHMLRQMGSNRGVHIEHKKDLMGYEATIDESTVVTRIYPRGFGGLELPERYIDSPLLDPDHPKIKMVEYDVKAAVGESVDDEDAIPLEDAYDLLRQYANQEFSEYHIDEPESTIHVDFVTLNNTLEYKDLSGLQEIRQGDVVRISIPDEEYEITSRLIAFKSDPLQENHYEHTTLGNHVVEFTSSGESIDSIRKELEDVRNTATIAMQSANGKNRNFYGIDEPSHPSLGDLWYQNNGQETIMWQYVEVNGERFWREIANTADTEATKQAVEQAQAEIDTLSDQIDSGINELNGKIDANFISLTGITDHLETLNNQAQQTANQALSNAATSIGIAQDALSKADGLDTLTQMMQVDINEIEGTLAIKADQTEVSTLNQTVHRHTLDILANAQGLQAKAEQSDVDLLNGTVQQLGADLDFTAGQITSKVWQTDISSAIDSINVGGRNYIQINNLGVYGQYNSAWGVINEYTIETTIRDANRMTLRVNDWNPTGGHFILSGYMYIDDDPITNSTVTNLATNWSNDNTFIGENGYFEHRSVRTGSVSWIIHIFNSAFMPVGSVVRIEYLKFEKGTKPTDWTPSPEDIYSSIELVETEWKQTAQGFDQSILQINTDLNGKAELSAFNTLNSTVQSTISRIGTAEGKINSVESTANGTQQIVSGPNGLTTQVATIADGFNVWVSSFEDLDISGRNYAAKSNIGSYAPYNTIPTIDVEGTLFSTKVGTANFFTVRIVGLVPAIGEFTTISGYFKKNGNPLTRSEWLSGRGNTNFSPGTLYVDDSTGYFENTQPGNGSSNFVLHANFGLVSGDIVTIEKFTVSKGGKAFSWSPAPEDVATKGQLTVLSDQINLAVAQGDVLGRINVQAGRTLIQNQRLFLDGTTTIRGGAFIDDAWISSLNVDNITMSGTLNGNNMNIININVSNLVGDRTTFVRSYWNGISNNVSIDGSGITVSHSDGSQTIMNANGLYHREGGSNYSTNYLFDVITVTGLNHSDTLRWVNVPAIYRGKQFKAHAVLADTYGVTNDAAYFNMAMLRVVCFVDEIDYVNGRVGLRGYSFHRDIRNNGTFRRAIQVKLILSY